MYDYGKYQLGLDKKSRVILRGSDVKKKCIEYLYFPGEEMNKREPKIQIRDGKAFAKS